MRLVVASVEVDENRLVSLGGKLLHPRFLGMVATLALSGSVVAEPEVEPNLLVLTRGSLCLEVNRGALTSMEGVVVATDCLPPTLLVNLDCWSLTVRASCIGSSEVDKAEMSERSSSWVSTCCSVDVQVG